MCEGGVERHAHTHTHRTVKVPYMTHLSVMRECVYVYFRVFAQCVRERESAWACVRVVTVGEGEREGDVCVCTLA
jgi:hypothetical protein